MTALAVEALSKNFLGVQALDGLSLEFGEGRCTGLIGPNGSGKSTLLNIACGLLPQSAGTVCMGGRRLERVKPYRILKYGVTRSFQDGRLIAQMSALDNVLLAMAERRPLRGLFETGAPSLRARGEAVLARVGLLDKKDAPAGGLSYGQRKLLEIARALATDARTFLLDEPFSGLFPEALETIAGVIEQLKSEGKTVVLIEHSMKLIARLCDHVVVLDAGRLLAQGKPDQVLRDPAVMEAYLGE